MVPIEPLLKRQYSKKSFPLGTGPLLKKILVADPLMIRRKPLVHQLSSLGFPEASEAESGSESLIRLKSEPHHALICSSNLENPDSLTLLKRIRESPNLAKLKVVMFFEDQEDERIVSATRAGMDAYLTHPVQEKDLKILLEKIW